MSADPHGALASALASHYALAVLHPDLAATVALDRFLREIKLCARPRPPAHLR